MTGHEDRNTAPVVITTPVIDDLSGSPADQDRAGGGQLVDQLTDRSGRPDELPVRTEEPIV